MSTLQVETLQVSNVKVDAAGNSGVFYLGSNTVGIGAGNVIIASGNSTAFNSNNIIVGNTSTLVINTTSVRVGNSTVNVFANSSMVYVGSNVIIDINGITIGNATINVFANSSIFRNGNVTVNSTALAIGANLIFSPSIISIGNSTVNASINSTGFYKNGAVPSGTDYTEIYNNANVSGLSNINVSISGYNDLLIKLGVTFSASTVLTPVFSIDDGATYPDSFGIMASTAINFSGTLFFTGLKVRALVGGPRVRSDGVNEMRGGSTSNSTSYNRIKLEPPSSNTYSYGHIVIYGR